MTEIEKEIKEMREEIKILTEEIRKLSQICGRMDGHISFVEKTYTRFSNPLNILKDKIENVFGKNQIEGSE